MSIEVPEHAAVMDGRSVSAVVHASPDVAGAWPVVRALSQGEPPICGLAAGDRPAADVEVLAGMVACVEYELARRMHAARAGGCLPLHDPGAMLSARGWAVGYARRLDRTGSLAAEHPSVAAAWAAGVITSEHVDPIARAAHRFTGEELAAVVAELVPQWGLWSPAAVARFVAAADRMLHPPPDPERDEADAYETRNLSFALTKDSVLISAVLPRLEGEAVIAAVEAFADRLRSTVRHVPAGARRADALVELVNAAAGAGKVPTRGGLPVALSVTVEHTALGDPVVTTGRGHQLTQAETRWACCDAQVTPVLVKTSGCTRGANAGMAGVRSSASGPGKPNVSAGALSDGALADGNGRGNPNTDAGTPTAAARIAALAALLFDTRIPLAVGRTARTATLAQRRALAARDRGCVIPGCSIPAEACQAHHLVDWAAGGPTDVSNMALLCWGHHRQVDLRMWTIAPAALKASTGGGALPASSWPANHGAPFVITRTPRHSWRN